MEKNSKLERFFEGKGFYIVLALCVIVIGISAFSIAQSSSKPDISTEISLDNTRPTVQPDVNEGTAPVVSTDAPDETDVSEEEPVSVWKQDDEWTVPTVWIWPVTGDIERGYSVDALAYDVTMADWRTHDGIDISAEKGAEVRAAADGTVIEIADDELYGTTVVITHGGGIETSYSNLAESPNVKAGDKVRAGDIIGSVGATALCEIGEGNHVHFAISLDNTSADPLNYLPER